jgi:predicted amidohydrolase YtcJ
MILDGTPIERLACMRKPYADKNTFGRLNFTAEQLKSFMNFALQNNQQIIIHAVGDSAIATIINTMRDLHPDNFWKDKRVRLEHAEMAVVDKQDLKALRDLGIIVVQNPLHLTLPEIMGQRLDKSRTRYLQAMRSLIDNDIHFALGSDGPINPFLNLMFATIHPDNPPEALTLEEALIAYTAGSAFAEFKEMEKGTLAQGQLADIAVLSQNIFEIPREQLPATESILTFLDGKIVLDKKLLK